MQSHGRPAAPPRPLAALALALILPGCESVSPWTERNYVRAALPMLYEPVRTNVDHASGPFPGGSVGLGTLVDQQESRATGLEVEYAYRLLAPNSRFEGVDHSFYGGMRRFYDLDGRLRPHFGFGAFWEDFHVHHLPSGKEPAGLGLYADVGIDYMITSIHSIGLRVRDGARYEFADHHHGIRNGVEVALVASWHF